MKKKEIMLYALIGISFLFNGCFTEDLTLRAFLVPPEAVHKKVKTILVMPAMYPYDDMSNSEKREVCHKIDDYIASYLRICTSYTFIPANSLYDFFEPSDSTFDVFNESGYWNEARLYNIRQPLIKEKKPDAILQIIIGKSIANIVDGKACWNGVCRYSTDLDYEPGWSALNIPLFFFGRKIEEKGEVLVTSLYGELFDTENNKLWRDSGGLSLLMLVDNKGKTYTEKPFSALRRDGRMAEAVELMLFSLISH